MFARLGLLMTSAPKTPWLKLVNGSSQVLPLSTVAISSLGLRDNGKGTYVFQGTITALATGTPQILLHVDSGSTANRYLIQLASASTVTQLSRSLASAGSTTNDGSPTAGVEFAVGLVIDGVGGAIMSLDGAATISVAGGPTSGLTTLRIGNGVTGVNPVGGVIRNLWVKPGVALDATALRAAVAAF